MKTFIQIFYKKNFSLFRKIGASLALLFYITSLSPAELLPNSQARYLQTTVAPGEFNTARKGFTATLITAGNNKGQILVTGGFDGANYLDSAERFNPTTGSFVAIPVTRKMISKRMNHAAVTLPDGKILLTGGRSSSTTLTNTMEIYDPITDKFTNLYGGVALPNMNQAREFHTSTLVTDPLDPVNSSVIVTAGGSDGTAYLNKGELFTTGTGLVENTTNNMITARGKHAAYFFPSTATASKGSVLFLGGTNDVTTGLPVAKGANEYYDISLKTFVYAGITLTDPRVEFMHTDYSTTATPQIFVSGGRISATSVSATVDTITHDGTKFTSNPRGSMVSKRKNAVAISAFENSNNTNKKVYVIGGQDAGGVDLHDYETFNISTLLFAPVTPDTLISGRNNFKAIVLPLTSANGGGSNNGQIVLMGGENSSYPIMRTTEFLDTNVSQVTSTDMLFPRSDFEMKTITDSQAAGSHFSNYGKVLVFGGTKTVSTHVPPSTAPTKEYGYTSFPGALETRTEVELYDPLTNKYTDLCTAGRNAMSGACNNPAQELRVQRMGFSATQMPDGKIYIIGGIAPLNYIHKTTPVPNNTVEIFDPQTSTFTVVPAAVAPAPLPGRAYHQASILSNDQILITGGTDWTWTTIGAQSYKTQMTQSLIYTISTGTFTDKWNGVDKIGLTKGARWGHTSATIGGVIYLAGGGGATGTSMIEKYDAGTGQFISVATTGPSDYFLKSIVYNGKILLYGGSRTSLEASSITYSSPSDILSYYYLPNIASNTTTIFDSATGTVVPGPTFSQVMSHGNAVQLDNGKYFIVGSLVNAKNSTPVGKPTSFCRKYIASINPLLGYLFDPSTETINALPGNLKRAQGGMSLIKITDALSTINKGKILLAGGVDSTTTCETPAAYSELYDPDNLTPATPDDTGGMFVPQNNQTFTTHQPALTFFAADPEGDDIKYQVQIVDQAIGFPIDDFEPTNAASLTWNFIQVNDQTGFTGQDGINNAYYKSNSFATLDLSTTTHFLPSGAYSMRIRAIDPIGSHTYSPWGPANSGGVINFTVNAEENAPVSTITTPLAQTYANAADIASLMGTASDSGVNASGVKKVMVSVKDNAANMYWNDTNDFTFGQETFFAATGTTGWNYPRTGVIPWVSGKTYTVHTYAVDNVGNVEMTGPTVQFTYDTNFIPTTVTITAPTTAETVGNGQTKTITWNISGGVVPAAYDVLYSKDDFVTSTTLQSNLSGVAMSYDWIVPNDATTNAKVRVIAKNAGGQVLGTGTSSGAFTISGSAGDTTAPTITLISPTTGANVSSLSSITGTYADAGTVTTLEVSLRDTGTNTYYDGTGFLSSTENKRPVTFTGSPWTFDTTTVPFLPNTNYEVKAYATDAAGNIGAIVVPFSYNTTPTNTNTNTTPVTTPTNTNTNTTPVTTPTNTNTNTTPVTTPTNTNTNTTPVTTPTNTNTNTTPVTTTTTTTQPTIIVTGGGSGGSAVYPIYPASYNAPVTSTSTTTPADTVAPQGSILYPEQGAHLSSLSSFQGIASDNDNGSGVGYVLITLFDKTTNKYFDGTRFIASQPSEFKASGSSVWSLAVPDIFTRGHLYTATAHTIDNAGNKQSIAAQVDFEIGDAPVTSSIAAATTTAQESPQIATIPSQLDQQFATMAKAIEKLATKAQTPVNVQVAAARPAQVTTTSTPTTTSTHPAATTPATTSSDTAPLMETSALPDYNKAYQEYLTNTPMLQPQQAPYDTIGMRDTDSDGLSDQLEMKLGTDPFKHDTDSDGFSDGEEVIEFATNPLDPNSKPGLTGVRITNLDQGTTTSDQRPLITGFAKPGSPIVLYDIKSDGTKEVMGTSTADERGRFIITPTTPLAAGEHSLATVIKGTDGKDADLSPVKNITIDPSLQIPAPEVHDIKTPSKKPLVFGKTQYGTTVVAHFQSLVTSSSIIADTSTGDFIVASAMPLEDGEHKVTLYAILPNGLRSPSVTVPFKIVNGMMSSSSSLKADITDAGGNVWWLLGALLPLILLLYTLWYFFGRRDTVLFSINTKDLSNISLSKVGDAYSYTSSLPMTKRDLDTEYLAFYLQPNDGLGITSSLSKDATEETIILFGKIIDMVFIDTTIDHSEINQDRLDTKNIEKYKIKYIFEQISADAKKMPFFTGKKYIKASSLVTNVTFIESTRNT